MSIIYSTYEAKARFSEILQLVRSGWIGALVLAVAGAGAFAAASEPGTGEADPAYRMTLQVLGGMASCGDKWSGPEYYGAATRRDLEVEEELDGIRGEMGRLAPRIEAFDERIEPLLPREHNTVPLSDYERQELDALRERELEIERDLKERARQLSYEERWSLESEQSEVKQSVRRLEDSILLTEEEARFLGIQKEQRALLAERMSFLRTRKDELTDLISMTTPGWLRVYPNDSLRLRLMENDALADDTCATWNLTLDREILDKREVDLKKGDRALLRLWVRPDSQ